ncbi:NYN domain-containing protein [Rhodobacteraceae bacterium 2CG4]|uniref:NYN domain-containing protein n=1 Tax=Halovulum marinum TaxID=2662447 RepID=A0A6L5Z711_9RHOB|nr:NYN domain-containing protein [Halovulum marinum]MSU92333.1 NYN domain-containing protein [Halovulum marinum]
MNQQKTSDFTGNNNAPNAALLVDGENISSAYAGRIITQARQHGQLTVRRVYGGVRKIPDWDAAPGFRMIHAGTGKNAADVMLAIDAVALSYEGRVGVFVLATSDGDFSYLALHLRERGCTVIGLGEKKAPIGFRKSCHKFLELKPADVEAEDSGSTSLPSKVKFIIEEHGGEMEISKLNPIIRRAHEVKISTLPEGTWRGFLEKHKKLFECDPKGAGAMVRLRK